MFGAVFTSIWLCLATPFSQPGYNPEYTYNSQDSLIWKAIVQVDAEQFESAMKLFQKVIEADSTSPKGYFFIAAAYSNLVSDYRNFGYRSEFYEHVDKAIQIGELKEKSGDATVEDLFYYGGAVGYRGIFRSFDGDWWGAFTDGLRGRRLLAKALEADTSYMDVYLGLGTYDYWRSAKTKALWWLPFFSDKREQGIQEIKESIANGKFAGHEGKYALMRIYFDYGKYEEAIRHWETEVQILNSEDPFSHYWLGRSYIKAGQYQNALSSFKTILAVYLKSPYYDPGGEMECRYFMGLCHRKLGDFPRAAEQLRLAAIIAEQLSGRKDLEEILEEIEPLLENIENELRK